MQSNFISILDSNYEMKELDGYLQSFFIFGEYWTIMKGKVGFLKFMRIICIDIKLLGPPLPCIDVHLGHNWFVCKKN